MTEEITAISGTRKAIIKSRFNEKFEIDKETDCWLWTACLLPNGYGAMQVLGKKTSAHRLSWVLHNGEIPDGLFILHRCDIKRCVNPDHLFLGTQKDNVADMHEKGRNADVKGEKNALSKLTEQDVIRIKERKLAGLSSFEIAESYDVCYETINNIIRGKSWRHTSV